MELTHELIPHWECAICFKMTSVKEVYERHYRTVHREYLINGKPIDAPIQLVKKGELKQIPQTKKIRRIPAMEFPTDPRLNPTLRKNSKTPVKSGKKMYLKTLNYDPIKEAVPIVKPVETNEFPSTAGGFWRKPPNDKNKNIPNIPATVSKNPELDNEKPKKARRTRSPSIQFDWNAWFDKPAPEGFFDRIPISDDEDSTDNPTPTMDEQPEVNPKPSKKILQWTDDLTFLDIEPVVKLTQDNYTQTEPCSEIEPEIFIGYSLKNMNLHEDQLRKIKDIIQ
jgi:hypothetical protein